MGTFGDLKKNSLSHRYLLQNIVIFATCGLTYYAIEYITRGYSDISMLICAGIIGVVVGIINDVFTYEMLLQTQLFIGTIVATVCEGITGLILVWKYGYNPVWDYSNLCGTFFGGQCNIFFCMLWIGLVFLAILIADSINYYLFDGERPYYKVGKDKVWFMFPEKKT